MTDYATHHVDVSTSSVTHFFDRIWNGLIHMAENTPRAKAVQKLNQISDAELAACGTTRQEVVRRMFAGLYYA